MKALVIEDSRLARKELVEMVSKFLEIEELCEIGNGSEAVEKIKEFKPDIIFLDIHLPGKSGFEVLEELDFVPPVIFTTAFDEYAIKSFEYNAVDYLMKPIRKERLEKAMKKLFLRNLGIQSSSPEKLDSDQQVFVRDGDRCWFVKIEDIRMFESVGNYTRIYFNSEKPLILKSLNYLEGILEDKRYFRVNRQQIINVKYVESIATGFNGKLRITMVSGEEVDVSRRQSTEFKVLFSI